MLTVQDNWISCHQYVRYSFRVPVRVVVSRVIQYRFRIEHYQVGYVPCQDGAAIPETHSPRRESSHLEDGLLQRQYRRLLPNIAAENAAAGVTDNRPPTNSMRCDAASA